MKKIVVEKTDGIAEVIDRILNEQEDEVTIVVPRSSELVRSMSNFRLLKREAESAGKDVSIESVDETVLAFAKECGIPSAHPLWRGVRNDEDGGAGGKGMSDIIPKSRVHAAVSKKKKPEPEPEPDESDESDGREEPEHDHEEFHEENHHEDRGDHEDEDEDGERETSPSSPGGNGFFKRPQVLAHDGGRRGYDDDDEDDDDDDGDNGPRRRIAGKIWGIIAIIVILVLGGGYVASAYFNHANISISFKKTPWNWQGDLTVDQAASADDLASGVLVGQVFTSDKNITDTFKASGNQDVSLKAKGTITIYNDYSIKPQELVATTRFLTPDGKIFRITNNVTVPGATKAADGSLQASSITAPIVADQPGPDYNIGPVAKLSVPGFQGDPQYDHFWGTITASTTGGFTGNRAVPTAADVTAAEASTSADLQASLQGGFSGSYPNNFKILDGATQITTGKLTVNTTTDDQGNFTVFATATLAAIGFDETALKTALLSAAQSTEASSTFADVTLNYSNVSANFSKGKVSFSLSAQGDLEPALSPMDFEQQILGKDTSDARTIIAALPQLSNAEISVWPSWLSTIPSDPSKVQISVQ